MQLKSFLLITLFFSNIFCTQEQDDVHPCLDKEKMHKKLVEIAKKNVKISMDLKFVEIPEKHEIFRQQFLELPEDVQKMNVETWLACDRVKQIVAGCSYLKDNFKNKKFDEQCFDFLLNVGERIVEFDAKEELICSACSELLAEDGVFDEVDMIKVLNELKIKMLFHLAKKEEERKFIERQKELQELEEKAKKFDSIDEFLEYDRLHEDRIYRGSRKNLVLGSDFVNQIRKEYLDEKYEGKI